MVPGNTIDQAKFWRAFHISRKVITFSKYLFKNFIMAAKTGMGSISFWGITPAVDLQEFIDKEKLLEPIRILTIGQADIRHILKTLESKIKSTEECVPIHFYIIEANIQSYSRQILLLLLSFMQSSEIGLHEKATQFMEMYGNILLRPQTKRTFQKICDSIVNITTNQNSLAEIAPYLKLDNLKFRERDGLADISQHWKHSCDSKIIDVKDYWDRRLRNYLTTRYDSRMGVFDWDYNMTLLDKEQKAKIIHIQEYKHWRNTGMAFSEFESDYSQPNSSLITRITMKQSAYVGDIITGPFISHGIHTEDKELYAKYNEQYKKKSYDVAFHNLQEIFNTISIASSNFQVAALENKFTVNFLPVNSSKTLKNKEKFSQFFDMVYVGSNMAQEITPDMMEVAKNEANIIIEKATYALEFRKEQIQLYETTVKELASKAGLKLIENENEDLARYFMQFTNVCNNLEETDDKSEIDTC